MTTKLEIFKKDLIKINIYKEVILNRTVSLDFFLENNTDSNDYMTYIHNDDIVVNRYGCFSISEDKNGGFINIRPALVKMNLKIIINKTQEFSENKYLTVFRNGFTDAEQSCDITKCNSIKFIVDGEKYIIEIENSDFEDIQPDNRELKSEPPETQEPILQENTETSISQEKLNAIKTETEKNYEEYTEKLQNIKEEYEFDKSLLEYYKDNDIVPVEKIFEEIEEKLKLAEEQIKLFIEARQNKIKEIQE